MPDAGVYSAASGLEAYSRAQEVIANNLANVSTAGFKRRLALFQPFQAQLAAELGDRVGTQLGDVVIDFSPGPIQSTGNPYDLAIHGDGFFVLEGPEGRLYTRKGSFVPDAEGSLVDSVGRPLLGNGGGRLTIPQGARDVRVDQEGRVFADGSEVGQVWVVEVERPAALRPVAYTAFALPADAAQPRSVEQPRVAQGALEGSNTNPIDELVSMITNLRSFEAAQRALLAIDESTQSLTKAASAAS